jgi:hypothetical protein
VKMLEPLFRTPLEFGNQSCAPLILWAPIPEAMPTTRYDWGLFIT